MLVLIAIFIYLKVKDFKTEKVKKNRASISRESVGRGSYVDYMAFYPKFQQRDRQTDGLHRGLMVDSCVVVGRARVRGRVGAGL